MERRSLIASLLLHASLVAAVLLHGGGQGSGRGNGNDPNGTGESQSQTTAGNDPNGTGTTPQKNGNIIDKPVKAELVPEKDLKKQIEKDQKRQMALEEKARKEREAREVEDKCPFFYGGIGITNLGNIVGHAHQGYPAYEAGIQDGDVLITDPEQIRGEIGTPVRVIVRRGGNILTFDMVRARICVEW